MEDREGSSWVVVDSALAKSIAPRIILHGGAGNISRRNLEPEAHLAYKFAMLSILSESAKMLQRPGASALDVAVHAVGLLEDDPLFNAGKGAVFARNGVNELEASVMVSDGYRKLATSCMLLKRVKNPIKLAKEMLIRGQLSDGGGAQGHCQLSGEYLEELASQWGLEMVEPQYFFTQWRWDEHTRGLQQSAHPKARPLGGTATPVPACHGSTSHWDGNAYLPQGTVGAVVLDSKGTICVATSTGGLTNKLPGRIGDTPTIGAGFWAEEWHSGREADAPNEAKVTANRSSREDHQSPAGTTGESIHKPSVRHVVGMSGTGNGDSFLRTNAVRTAAAISRFSSPSTTLDKAVTLVAGPGGLLQESAGDRWGFTGEGEGGIIGIEAVGGHTSVVADFNCNGMFRAWVDNDDKERFMVFRGEY